MSDPSPSIPGVPGANVFFLGLARHATQESDVRYLDAKIDLVNALAQENAQHLHGHIEELSARADLCGMAVVKLDHDVSSARSVASNALLFGLLGYFGVLALAWRFSDMEETIEALQSRVRELGAALAARSA